MKYKLMILLMFAGFLSFANAQDTGTPSYEPTVQVNPYESVNLSNLNILLQAPIRSKGGPIPMQFMTTSNALLSGTSTYRSSAENVDFAQGAPIGDMLYTTSSQDCGSGQTTVYHFTALLDGNRTQHPITPSLGLWNATGCGGSQVVDTYTTDHTGYEVVIVADVNGQPDITVYDKAGKKIHKNAGVSGNRSIIDTHGNEVDGTFGSSMVYTDDLTATPSLSYTLNDHSSPTTYTYTDGTGTLRNITASYLNGTANPAIFNCSGYSETPYTYYPLQQVSYPDSSSVQFTWKTEGRLNTTIVPTGATYTHSYSGGTNGDGLWCEGSLHGGISNAVMTITNGTGTWTFNRTLPVLASGMYTWTTTVTKPDNSVTVYSFNTGLITKVVVKDTNGTTVLDTMTYCYDSTFASCNPAAPTQQPIWLRVYHTVPGVATNAEIDTQFDTYGNVTEIDRFDFGPTLINKTLITYGDWNGSSCTSMVAAHITGKPCEVFTKDASNNVLTHSRFDYNTSTGDLLHTYAFYDATHFLTSTATYNSNGTMATSTAADGVLTTVGNSQCNGLLPDHATTAVGTTSMTWDCNGALPSTSTGLNGITVTTTYGDSLYRVTQVSDNGGQAPILYTYPSITRSSKHMTFNGGASISDTTTTLNTLGQVVSVQQQTAPGSANYDTITYAYNTTGRKTSISTACTTTVGGTCATHAVEYTYDGLGRLKTKTAKTTTNGVLTYTYPTGDVKTVLTPAPTGENSKITQIEADGLGRTKSVCQVVTSGLSGTGACGQRTAATGYKTTYTLDPLGRATTISRNSQTGGTAVNSTASYDFLSRVLSATVPESGTTTTQYDTAHNDCTSPLAGHLNRTLDAVGNETCLSYDSVGRLSAVTFPAGSYAAVTPQKHFQYDSNTKGGTNLVGELARGYTCFSPCSTIITDEQFGKDEYGRTTDVWQNSTGLGSGNFFHTTASYFDNGAPATVGGIPGSITGFSYGLDGEGRPFSAIVGSLNVVTSVAYDPAGAPTTATYSTGDTDVYSWDAPTRNMTQYQFKVGAALTTDTGTLTWNPNGTLKQLAIVDNLSSLDNQTCTTVHDDLVRITSWNCGAVWNETYAYSPDYAGNVTKSGSLGFVPGYAPATNRFLAPYTYDANGNLKHDATLGIDYGWDASGSTVAISTTAMLNDVFGRSVQAGPSGYYLYTPIGLVGGATSLTAMSSGFVRLPGGATQTFVGSSQFTLHTDHTGSARMASNFSARTFNQLWSLGPMGEIYKGTNTNPMYEGIFSYTVTGLYDYLDGASRYSGTWGRTVTPTGGENGYVKDNSPF